MTELLKLTPAAAVLVTLDALGRVVTEEEVPAALVQRGDHLKVRALASGALLVWACTAILARASSPASLASSLGCLACCQLLWLRPGPCRLMFVLS